MVRGILRARHAPPGLLDDALQAAAERALRRTAGFDSLEGWVNWTIKVAWHEIQADWHCRARSCAGDVPEPQTDLDPARIVEGRFEFEAATASLRDLNEADQEAILSAIEEPLTNDGATPASMKMRRSRARQRLAAILNSDI